MFRLSVLAFITALTIVGINGHGRVMKPPNRSSIHRIPEFSGFNPPQNWDDTGLFCGTVHQEQIVGGPCGVCGDPFSDPAPRANEIGGKWYAGIITGKYTAGQVIDIDVEITAAHMGYMEWRLCTHPEDGETQEYFNQYLLQRADGAGSKVDIDVARWYKTQFILPEGVTCPHCVLQWNYRAGNNNGLCDDGTSRYGCGPRPQETFRGCSDISIV